MAIYIPRHFACDDETVAREIVRAAPFATLITPGDAEPWITHAPLSWGAGDTFLMGHIAKANPHARLLEIGSRTLALFHGPHAYVSPGFYESPGQVPTWNYATVHVVATPEVLSADDTVRELRRLVADYESDWHAEDDHVSSQAMGVVAFRLHIGRIDIKLKMSQNKSEADRAGVISGLRARNDAESDVVADWVERLC